MDKKNSSAKKKPKRRFFSRQFETVFIVIIVLSAFSVVLFIAIDKIFPNNGGFTRSIFFIKPNQDGDPTYFIAIDDIYPTNDNIPVDWILHGRGNLTIFNNNQSAVWAVDSYLNSDTTVKLYAIFIEPRVTISESTGPFYPTQDYTHAPIMLPFIKARAIQTGPTRFITLLYPLNESQTLPNITTNTAQGVTYIGSNDLLFSQDSGTLRNFDNFTTDAPLLFLRSDGENISSFIMKEGSRLSDQNRTYVSSQNTISINLEYQSSDISGMIWVSNLTEISLWVPRVPLNATLNGVDIIPTTYDSGSKMATFTVYQNGSLLISYAPVKSQPPDLPPPPEKPQPPLVKNGPPETYGPHPYLYFNDTTLPTLRNQVLTQQPWQNWFSKIETNADNHLDDDISTVGSSTRFISALDLAFTGVMKLNMTYINKSKAFLQAMDDITDYNSHLDRSSACSHYSIAFDMIYQNLTLAERVEIANKLGNHTLPLLQKIDYLPRNNHIAIVASGLGLSGLVLEKNDWVTRAITGVDEYFATSFASDGGCYEGYSYAGFFLHSGLKFFNALNNLGGKNYFAEPKFISFINNTIHCLSPLMIIPLFEDSATQAEIIESLLWSAAPIYPHAPLLSNYSQWVWETRQLNDVLSYDGTYLKSYETSYHSGLVTRVCMYSMNITAVQPPLETLVVNRDSGLAFLRSDWDQDALYLSITCKRQSQYQYHAHYDENSFEIWAYGAWLAANPGYPGFGYGEYDYIISTEASNTILLNDQDQQQVNGDGFQEHFSSSTIDGVIASANSIYSSPGNFAMNENFLGVLIFIITSLVAASIILVYFRHRAYKTNIIILPEKEQTGVTAVRLKNLSLKVHLTLIFGLSFGIIVSLISFYLFVNPYVQVYVVGKHEEIMSLIPIIQIALLILIIPFVLLLLFFKFKMQNSLLRRIIIFSSNLKEPQIPPLKNTIKYSYLPQTYFLIIFLPIMIFLYVPLVNAVVDHIFTAGGSLIDIENFMINTLNTFILLFALTLLLYLPFKIVGIYLGGKDISKKLRQPISDSILMLTVSYLLTLTVFILVIFFLSLALFYALNYLGISFIV